MRNIDIPSIESIKARLDEITEGQALFLDGFDDALVGVSRRFNGEPVACYSIQHILSILVKDMTYEEAVEHFEFNIIGAWLGDYTPVYIDFEEI